MEENVQVDYIQLYSAITSCSQVSVPNAIIMGFPICFCNAFSKDSL